MTHQRAFRLSEMINHAYAELSMSRIAKVAETPVDIAPFNVLEGIGFTKPQGQGCLDFYDFIIIELKLTLFI
jgi:hypothetical protein